MEFKKLYDEQGIPLLTRTNRHKKTREGSKRYQTLLRNGFELDLVSGGLKAVAGFQRRQAQGPRQRARAVRVNMVRINNAQGEPILTRTGKPSYTRIGSKKYNSLLRKNFYNIDGVMTKGGRAQQLDAPEEIPVANELAIVRTRSTFDYKQILMSEYEVRSNNETMPINNPNYEYDTTTFPTNADAFLNQNSTTFRNEMAHAMNTLGPIRFQMSLIVYSPDKHEFILSTPFYSVRSANAVNTEYENATRYFQGLFEENMNTYRVAIVGVAMRFTKLNMLAGGSFIPTPAWVSKKAALNIKNTDNRCFMYALLAQLVDVNPKHANRPQKYNDHFHLINVPIGATFPVELNDVHKWQDANPQLSINVFYDAGGNIAPSYMTENRTGTPIDLLYIFDTAADTDTEIEQTKAHGHYITIRNLSCFHDNKHKEQIHLCRHCLRHYQTDVILANHNCEKATAICKMPAPGSVVKFKNFKHELKQPFVIYADIETFNIKRVQADNIRASTATTLLTDQEFASGAYLVIADNMLTCHPRVSHEIRNYLGYRKFENMNDYLNDLSNTCDALAKIITETNIPYSFNEAKNYDNVNECYHCKVQVVKTSNSVDNRKCIDHEHLNGKIRGVLCNKCNLQMKRNSTIPVLFHNFSGYDSHFIVQALKQFPNSEPRNIARNSEKISALTVNNMRFFDSFRHLPSSLDKLSSNLDSKDMQSMRMRYPPNTFDIEYETTMTKLNKDVKDCHADDMKQQLQTLADKYMIENIHKTSLNIVCRKGVFPYEWFDSPEKFNATELPSIEEFHSHLSGDCKPLEYQYAQLVWKTTKCKTFRDYHDLYLECDIRLLADVFENYRDITMKNYGLDPVCYITSPSLAWDAMLKMTNVEIELISDREMYDFFMNSIRGGVSMISHRYAKANLNPSATEYGSNLFYGDANNLYGGAMIRKLPLKDFMWCNDITWKQIKKCEEFGYHVEADIEYPSHIKDELNNVIDLHELHSDYPVLPERMHSDDYIKYQSQYNINIKNACDATDNGYKLVPNLFNKTKYIVKRSTLMFAESLGLKVTKIHRVCRYTEEAFLQPYIELNTSLRTDAKNDFEKDFYKLMNNSVYGKTFESPFNRANIVFASNEKSVKKSIIKPQMKTFKRLNNTTYMFVNDQKTYELNKPIQIGAAILDLSKEIMQNLHYNVILPAFGPKNVKLCMTDTDSLFYHIKGTKLGEKFDFYKVLQEQGLLEKHFDTSACVRDDIENFNEKVLLMLKDEAEGKLISEYIGMNPKVYAYVMTESCAREHKKAKGVQKHTLKTSIKMQDYKDILAATTLASARMQEKPLESCQLTRDIYSIQSRNHRVNLIKQSKKCLVAYDSKRYILEDGIETRAHGDYRNAAER